MVSYDRISVNAEITLSKDNPAVTDLISGQTSLPKFINDQLDLRIGDSQVAFEFRDVRPRITIDGSAATVAAVAELHRSNVLPVIAGTVSFTKSYDARYPLDGDDESLSVKVEDFNVNSYNPAPTILKDGAAVWSGARDSKDQHESVQVSIDYNPLGSPSALFRTLALSPYEIFSWRVSSLLTVLFGILYVIPILWTLWLLEKHPVAGWADEQVLARLRRLGAWLLAISLVPSVSELSYAVAAMTFEDGLFLSYFGHAGLPGGDSTNNPVVLSLSCVAVTILILLLLSTVMLVTRRPSLKAYAKILFRGYSLAAAINLVLAVAIFGIKSAFARSENLLFPSALIVFPILLLMLYRGVKLYEQVWPHARKGGGRRPLALFLLALALAYPFNSSIYSIENNKFPTWEITWHSVRSFFYIIQELTPRLFLLGVMPLLKTCPREEENSNRLIISIGLLLFSAYVIGTTANWFVIPIPFLLALWLYPRLVRQRLGRLRLLNKLWAFVSGRRRELLDKVFLHARAQQLAGSVDQLGKKVASGDLTLVEFLERKGEIDGYAGEAERDNVVGRLSAKDVVLSFGPEQSNWRNGVHAVKYGTIIVMPFLLLFGGLLFREIRLGTSYIPLLVGVRLFAFVMDWIVSAFFFGYFFTQLRGDTGLTKGLNAAVSIILCFTPVWLMSGLTAVELSATFLRAGQIFLFFTILGVAAFDYVTFRKVLQEQFSWRKFTQFGDMPSFTAVASVLLTSAGVAISTALSGQFTSLVAQIVRSLFPQLPGPLSK